MTSQTEFAALLQELEPYRKTDPLRFLKGVAAAANIADPDYRFLRAEVLHALAMKLHGAARLCDFPNEIVVRPQGVFVNATGVLMESSRTGIYLKSSGAPYENQGVQLSKVLARMNISVTTAVDVGANFGEISLWLAREYPDARVVAIEPSTDNLSVFELNKNAQNFATDRLETIRHAVSDRAGTVAMSTGAGAMNRVVAAGETKGTETVQCDRLDTLFDRHGIRTADFVKIDIEGGEPELRGALLALGHRVRSYYIEFSQFAPLDDYLALASALFSLHFACYDEAASSRFTTVEDVARHLKAAFATGPIAVTNLWFIGQEVTAPGN
jgi:FkbM family methyltransferase